MSDSYRLTVLKKLTDHLKGITIANGAAYDLSTSVFRGRTIFGDGDPLPMLSLLESPRSDSGSFAGETERKDQWTIMIQGWVADDIDNPTDPAYGLMDAVEKRLDRLTACSTINGKELYPAEYLLGRSIADLVVPPGVVRPPMEGVSSKAFFYLPIRITLVKPNE